MAASPRSTQVQAHLAHVDGVMLGRAAYHDPYVLAQVEAALYGVPLPSRESVLQHLRPYVEAELARGTALKHISRHLLGLYQGEPGARAFRRTLERGGAFARRRLGAASSRRWCRDSGRGVTGARPSGQLFSPEFRSMARRPDPGPASTHGTMASKTSS